MNIDDVRDIHIAIREKLPPSELSPELFQQIIDVMLQYVHREVKN